MVERTLGLLWDRVDPFPTALINHYSSVCSSPELYIQVILPSVHNLNTEKNLSLILGHVGFWLSY